MGHSAKWCFLDVLHACVLSVAHGSLALLAGSDTVVHPIFHLNMDIDDASQARALTAFSNHGWSIQSGRNESGCGSTLLCNLNYGARMMTHLSYQRTLFEFGNR